MAIAAAFIAFGTEFILNYPAFQQNTDLVYWWAMYGDQLDACYGVALVFLLISTYKALKQMKKLAAKQTGVKTIMILFCVLFLMRICSTVTMHVLKNHINNIYTSKNIFF